MKNFSYTAKDETGSLTYGCVKAVDRVAALQELKTKGLVPIEVLEGNLPANAYKRLNMQPRVLTLAVVLIAVTAAVILVYVGIKTKMPAPEKALVSDKNEAKVPPLVSPQEESKPVPAEAPVVPVAEPQTAVPVRQTAVPEARSVRPRAVAHAAATAEQPKKPIRGAQKRLADAIEKGLPTEPLFKHETESILAFYTRPGEPVPPHPLPDNIEEAARRALAEDIVVTDADTPEQEQEKEMVAWLKEYLRQHLASGGTAKDFFEQLQVRQEEESKLFLEARAILGDIHREGNTEATMAAHKALNETLKEKGIAPLPLPGGLRKQAK